MSDSTRCLRAAWVVPIAGPPIENGEVLVAGDRIVDVRPARPSSPKPGLDFGDAILMPGLVNVHTHLDYTVMRGLLEDLDFFPWIRELTARKEALTWEDWVASATWGAAEAVAGGVTTIGDCTDSGAAFYGAKALGLSGTIYQEVFGIDAARSVGEIVEELAAKITHLQTESVQTHLRIGISPHAPYTVRPDLFRALADYARRNELAVCIHAAESQAEAELLRSGTGPISEVFVRRRIFWETPHSSAVAYLASLGILSSRTLLVHGVQVSAQDRALLQRHEVAWAHCPKSNAKLGNGIAPLHILRHALRHESGEIPNLRIGLGSDSVASNNTMDLFEEMRFAVLIQRGRHHRIQALSAPEAVEMATLGGARALGVDAEVGTLEPGKRADLCVVRLNDLHSAPAYHPYNAVWTMIAGEVRYDAACSARLEERFPQTDLAPVRKQLHGAAQKMRQWRASVP
jgi:cytosine/adenosine deaminase-related metal-dependent hydrolase